MYVHFDKAQGVRNVVNIAFLAGIYGFNRIGAEPDVSFG